MESTRTAKRNRIIALIFGIALLVGVGAAAVTIAGNNEQQAGNQTQNESTPDPNTLTFTAEAGKTVLEQTHKHADVETENTGIGAYVFAINGVEAGTDDKFWTFYVDGKPADKGAADYTTKGGEVIEWKFEKFE